MVSVIVLSYNSSPFIIDCMTSILRQTYTDYELLLLYYGTLPESSYYIKDHAVSYIPIEPSSNASSQWLAAAEQAKGDLLWIVDPADTFDERFLENLVKTYNQHPDASFAYSNSIVMNEEGKDRYAFQQRNETEYTDGKAFINGDLLWGNNIATISAALISRRHALSVLRSYKESFSVWLFFIMLAEEGGVAHFDTAYCNYRYMPQYAEPGAFEREAYQVYTHLREHHLLSLRKTIYMRAFYLWHIDEDTPYPASLKHSLQILWGITPIYRLLIPYIRSRARV